MLGRVASGISVVTGHPTSLLRASHVHVHKFTMILALCELCQDGERLHGVSELFSAAAPLSS